MSVAQDAPEQYEPDAPPEQVVVVLDGAFPEDRRFWTDETMEEKPTFGVSEMAKVFFAKGPDWLRWRSDPVPPRGQKRKDMKFPDGWFILDGERLEAKRTSAGARYYTLYDIERMAHALHQNGGIGPEQLARVVRIVKDMAELYGYLGESYLDDPDDPNEGGA